MVQWNCGGPLIKTMKRSIAGGEAGSPCKMSHLLSHMNKYMKAKSPDPYAVTGVGSARLRLSPLDESVTLWNLD